RPWAVPGTPGLEHRIGGLEKQDGSGNVCYDPDNHEHMIRTRQRKVDGIAETIPQQDVFGDESGELLVVGWGSTYGAIVSAVESCRAKGMDVSSIHVRYLAPMPSNLGAILKRFRRVVVAEMNLGQLLQRLRAAYLVDAVGLNKVQGKPFTITEIESCITDMLQGNDR
ncbi:MAG: 2-oxoglutarate ferredoxin oxidoreductase subunit alpha, partial [Phycisphaerae bacterium]